MFCKVRCALFVGLLLLYGFAAGCSKAPSPPDAALEAFQADRMLADIKTLASDEFEGRGPGSTGERKTIDFLQKKFRQIGLQPGNPDGTYLQKVPLVGITPDTIMKLALSRGGKTLRPEFRKDFVAWSKRVVEKSAIDAEIVFVGYGVQAPEFNWDDLKATDVRGKVLLVLVNDPPVEDISVFGGPAMTYYGRWTYKFEQAAKLGAAGCFIVHETERAGYGWDVVRNSWSGEQFDLANTDNNMGRPAIEGWVTWEEAEAIAALGGKDLAELKRAAVTREFTPVALGVTAKLEVQNTIRRIDSNNVIARLVGSDDKLKDEYVVYSAHWDHFGVGPEVNGDKIYNGAVDNATGTAALIEMARAYKELRVAPKRSLLFLAVTGEEQGLLGSKYYAEHPLYPLARTAAVVNMDALNVLGKARDIISIGMGSSTIDEVVEAVAKERGRIVKPDPEPEKGFFYRSDHFSFAKEGVPAFNPNEGVDFIGKPTGWGMEMRQKYTREDYHKPSDQVKPDWDLSGLVDDAQFFFLVGYKIANAEKAPEWKPGTEFKAVREESLRKASGTK
jgi:Zn-dependent M28 family amino/carboxypeptidase